jgi:cytochrome P450
MLDNEPPKHTRLKGLMMKAFTPARVEGLRGKIQAIVNALLDRAEDLGQMDLLKDYAEPLPVTVIAELLGVPEEDRRYLRPWSAKIVKLYELGYTEEQAREANQAVVEFSEYIRQLADERRKRPGDDLISALVQQEGDQLTPDELVANCILLLNAGHEATVNGTTAGFLALARNPQQMERAKEAAAKNHPEFFKLAVEELLRYDTPLPMFERWVLEDFDYKGIPLRRGSGGGPGVRLGQPRPAQVCQPRPARADPSRQPPPDLWPGHPLLHRGPAGAARAADFLPDPAQAAAQDLPGHRQNRVRRGVCHSWTQGHAGGVVGGWPLGYNP